VSTVTAQQQKLFEKRLAMFFYTSLTPLARLDSPELKSALAAVGVLPPSRKAASNKLLDTAYVDALAKVIKEVQKWQLVCVTMDGWKKKACEEGAPLITVLILLPTGKKLFWKVRSIHNHIYTDRLNLW
jgi:hypothetical protein